MLITTRGQQRGTVLYHQALLGQRRNPGLLPKVHLFGPLAAPSLRQRLRLQPLALPRSPVLMLMYLYLSDGKNAVLQRAALTSSIIIRAQRHGQIQDGQLSSRQLL